MNDHDKTKFKKRLASLAVASCLSVAPWVAEAAGLGKITVLSGLGQPLRAELEVTAGREEAVGMTAKLAPQDAFQQAGIDYASVLSDLRFSVEKRGNGRSVIKVTSSRPVNEPFLDFLVELNWPSGRLVREYTFLLDPPEVAAKSAQRPVSVAEAKVVEMVRGGGAAPDPVQPKAVATRPMPAPQPKIEAQPQPQPKKEEPTPGSHVVQAGETLRKIAGANQHEGVSLEQMLVGLFKANPEAFSGDNINRLKAGAILNMPDKAAVEAIPAAEAKKLYVAQAQDWNAYRQKLAAVAATAPARDDSASQAAAGKIVAKVEEKTPPVDQAKDQVRIARADQAAKDARAGKVAEEDRIAKEKALKEAQDRLALLEKNVNELQKLVEMKNQKLAELQQQNSAKKEEVPPKVADAPKPVEPVKPAEPVTPAPVEAKAPEPAKVVEEAKPVVPPEPPKAPEVKPPPKKVLPPAEPEPEPEPSLVDDLLGNPLPLAGGAGLLALLAGWFFYKRRRVAEPGHAPSTAIPGPSSLGPNSVFRMTGGQSIDTGNTPPQTGDFSQTGPGTIDTDEVDPVAEADVYMAYGRDAQAEEILIEALQKDPQRTAIHAKLLEIYANRNSLKQFETLASELYGQTGGVGPEWEKVAAMGARLDPANPLYSGGGQELAPPTFDADATLIISPEAARATLAMPGALAQLAEESLVSQPSLEAEFSSTLVQESPIDVASPAEPVAEVLPESQSLAVDDEMSLDFDLGAPLETAAPAEPEKPAESGYVDTFVTADSNALDFDLGMPAAPTAAEAEPVVTTDMDLSVPESLDMEAVDFDLGAAVEPSVELAEGVPDFSPEGTLVMPGAAEELTDTFVGLERQEPVEAVEEHAAEHLVDFELDMGDSAAATVVNPMALREAMEEVPLAPELMPEAEAASAVEIGEVDADSLEFDVKLTDSTILGQPMQVPSFDMGAINLDLAADEEVGMETIVAPESVVDNFEPPAAPVAEDAFFEEPAPGSDAFRDEVNTKLDLAKAYEEMGDLEGARELLNEVIGEGPPDLVEQAREILARVGE